MYVIILITIILFFFWVLEYRRHLRNLYAIPIRVHVNGTRGKSSVTRLIAAGLRAGGIRTYAKTTGTLPRIIDEEGLEIPVTRPHMVNIIEQLRIVRYMRKRSPQAMVVECMAVLPEYQWICEHRMIHSTVGVITNTRLDHIREMGPSLQNVALSLCNTIPPNGIAFTSEREMFHVMEKAASKMSAKLVNVESHGVSPEEMAGFNYLEHPDNVALALAVCEHLKVDRKKALHGMHASYPDVGAMKIFRLNFSEKQVFFINALAANDPQSTLELWNRVDAMFLKRAKVIVLLNTRADRYDRTLQLLEMVQGIPYDKLCLIGQKLEQVNASALKMDISFQKIRVIKRVRPEEVYERLLEETAPEGLTLIYAIGNMGAGGLQLADYFRWKYVEMEKLKDLSPQAETQSV
jgi:poly-gamma-glutamate synthase PgsB/CapB